MSIKDRIIVSIDTVNKKSAKKIVEDTQDNVGMYRVGLPLIFKEGLDLLEPFPKRVLLDLRLCDNKEALGPICRSTNRNIKYLTVGPFIGHSALIEVLKHVSISTEVLIATPLMQLTTEDLNAMGVLPESLRKTTLKIVKTAMACGVVGVLCKPEEVGLLRDKLRTGTIIVSDDVERIGMKSETNDQSTPYMAAKSGANFISVGSLITNHYDPGVMADIVADHIEAAIQDVFAGLGEGH